MTITAIQNDDGTIIHDVKHLLTYSDCIMKITGTAEDDYDAIINLDRSNRKRVEQVFDYVWVGNEFASVRMRVEKVLWSETLSHKFALVLIPPTFSLDFNVSNSSFIFTPTQTGWDVLSNHLQLRELGFTTSHFTQPRKGDLW